MYLASYSVLFINVFEHLFLKAYIINHHIKHVKVLFKIELQ